ncbi:MAG: energy transducer TonB [Pseudoxanthomonas sp.]
MYRSIRILLALGLLAIAGAGVAAGADKPATAWLRADIVLDANGTLSSIAWPDQKAGGAVLTDHLEKIIRTWEFEPGRFDGAPAITKTRLNLEVSLEKSRQGDLQVAILHANTGVGFNSMPPPRYPFPAAQRGYSAELRIRLAIDEQGKVASASVIGYQGESLDKWIRKAFEDAGMTAVQSWTFQPEQVAGKPLASQADVPILFCMESTWCKKQEAARRATDSSSASADQAIALDSAVKIRRWSGTADI